MKEEAWIRAQEAYQIESQCIADALKDASFDETKDNVYINAHGTGTHLNDKCETAAIKLALGEEEARKAVISSTKSMTGHMLGSAGAIEALVCALAISNSTVPPTIGLESQDPECDLDYTPQVARERKLDIAISNSLGFGGHNVCVALRPVK